MRKIPLSRAEKITARFTRGGREVCWLWEGETTYEGHPSLDRRLVLREIFTQEFGPIPPGYVLWRDDHTETCRPARPCPHLLCVNPHHLRLVKSNGGLVRKKDKDAVEGDQEDHDEPADVG